MKLSEVKWPISENRSLITKINCKDVSIIYNIYWADWTASKSLRVLETAPDRPRNSVFLEKALSAVRAHEDRWFGDV